VEGDWRQVNAPLATMAICGRVARIVLNRPER